MNHADTDTQTRVVTSRLCLGQKSVSAYAALRETMRNIQLCEQRIDEQLTVEGRRRLQRATSRSQSHSFVSCVVIGSQLNSLTKNSPRDTPMGTRDDREWVFGSHRFPLPCSLFLCFPIPIRNIVTDSHSPRLWNKLPFSLREPVSPLYAYLNPSFSSPLSPSITPSLFHSQLKTYLFGKSFPHRSLTIDSSDWLPRFSVFTVFVGVISCFGAVDKTSFLVFLRTVK